MADKRKPVETVKYLNNETVYKEHCAIFVDEGYTLVSAHCSADIDGNEYWLAIFALPEAMGRLEVMHSHSELLLTDELANALVEVHGG